MINALGKIPSNGKRLKSVAIRKAFCRGVSEGIKYFAEKFHEHLAITSKEYAEGLVNSWKNPKSSHIFPLLFSGADKDDLESVKQMWKYRDNPEFRDTVDNTIELAPLTGTRHLRFLERKIAKLAIMILDDLMKTGEWLQEPSTIIATFLLGNVGIAELMEIVKREKAAPRSSTEMTQAPSPPNLPSKANNEQEGRKGEK